MYSNDAETESDRVKQDRTKTNIQPKNLFKPKND